MIQTNGKPEAIFSIAASNERRNVGFDSGQFDVGVIVDKRAVQL